MKKLFMAIAILFYACGQGPENKTSFAVTLSGNYPQVSPGEYSCNFLDSKGYWYIGGAIGLTGGYGKQLGIPAKVLPNQTFAGICGGLHNSAAWDSAGYVYTVGDNTEGQLGRGNTIAFGGVNKILTDSAGNEFKDVVKMAAHYLYGSGTGFYAIKKDGSLWYWGSGKGGMRGNGTPGALTTRPAQIIMPEGRKVKEIVAGYIAIAVCTDGSVCTWGGAGNSNNLGYNGTGNDYQSPHWLTSLSEIEGVAGGLYFQYAYKKDSLFTWGLWGEYQGSSGAIGKPTYAAAIMKTLPSPIKKVVTISVCSYFLLENGSLWGCGDQGQGNLGNSKELDYWKTAQPFAWPIFKRASMQQVLPIKIIDSVYDIVGSTVYTFYTYAVMIDGSLRAWGRNKGAVIANGVVPCSSQEAAIYANSWDVTTPQLVKPFKLTKTIITPSPYCVLNQTISPCNQCKFYNQIPGDTTATQPPIDTIIPIPEPQPVVYSVSAGPDQAITGSIATLSGIVSPVDSVVKYTWRKLSGGSIANSTPNSDSTKISGLKSGLYNFEFKVNFKNGLAKADTVVLNAGGIKLPIRTVCTNYYPDGSKDSTVNTYQ